MINSWDGEWVPADDNLPVSAEAHQSNAGVRHHLPLIADTNRRQPNRPYSGGIRADSLRLMRLGSNGQAAGAGRDPVYALAAPRPRLR